MKRLWAPWRMKYILGDRPGSGCVFCDALAAGDDAAHYIVRRGQHAFVILNTFPYTNGHTLIVPNQHEGDLVLLDAATVNEMMALTQEVIAALRCSMNPSGFNVGMNLGESAGAGIRDHVHIHVVPRWNNDTNFMPVLGEVRVLPESLCDTYARLSGTLRGQGQSAEEKAQPA
ncbi:MAG TPA: HIT domain-containing protein [Anaerolineae bacterium]|nr:HIT domain-containing protein [Anaerolineae bacterium]